MRKSQPPVVLSNSPFLTSYWFSTEQRDVEVWKENLLSDSSNIEMETSSNISSSMKFLIRNLD